MAADEAQRGRSSAVCSARRSAIGAGRVERHRRRLLRSDTVRARAVRGASGARRRMPRCRARRPPAHLRANSTPAPTGWPVICAAWASAGRPRGDRVLNARSTWSSAQLAILKAGGAYVPLDPTSPPQRQAFMIATAEHASCSTGGRNRCPRIDGVTPIDIDRDTPGEPDRRGWAILRCDRGEATAYVIYTSGSTGQPKGVVDPAPGDRCGSRSITATPTSSRATASPSPPIRPSTPAPWNCGRRC